MKQLQTYTYVLQAGGSIQIPAPNDNFYILAATGPVTVRGDTFGKFAGLVAGQGLKGVPFNRLELFDESGAPNSVTVLLTPAEFVNQVFSGAVTVLGGSVNVSGGSVAISGDVSLSAATVGALRTAPSFTANYTDATAMGAGTTQQVFAPGVNINGALILSASWTAVNAALPCEQCALIGSSAAPGAFVGRVLMHCRVDYNVGGGTGYGATLDRPMILPAGNGLWFYCQSAESRGARSVLYTLL